jgi:hypothetical protein
MKQRAETKADIEKKIDQCNRRLRLIKNWQRNLSPAEQDRLSLSASVGRLLEPRQAPPRGRTPAKDHPAIPPAHAADW